MIRCLATSLRVLLLSFFVANFVVGNVFASDNYQRVLEELRGMGFSEGLVGGYDWIPTDQFGRVEFSNSALCTDELIHNYSGSVVRLHVPVRSKCEIGSRNPSQAQINRNTLDVKGCTAWRFSRTIFATAWHCMPDGAFSCATAEIGFDYTPDLEVLDAFDPSLSDREPNSADWHGITESCVGILYSNQVLDVVLFRVSQNSLAEWGGRAILPILPGTDSFPTKRDRLFMLQFPAPGRSSCSTQGARRLNIYKNYQMEEQLSIYSLSDPACRLQPRPDSESIRWYSGRNPYAERIPEEPETCDDMALNKFSGPNVSMVHFCDTCEMSSGAPILSLDGENGRACTVIGLHTGKGFAPLHGRDANVGVRLSVLGECIDFESSQANDQVALRTENAKNRPECLAEIPAGIEALDCRGDKRVGKGQVCEGYRQF